MSRIVDRPAEVEAEIERCEAAGDFEQAGYLMAPGLKKHTGDTLEEMTQVCAMMTLIPNAPEHFTARNTGVLRWINEQLEQQQ
jgi:hypothetical protein